MPARTLVIGDIHGCLKNLDALLESLSPGPDDHMVFLGDYVDRGAESAGVVWRILKLSQTHRATFVMGNHEQMMLDARTSQEQFSDWLRNGGDATLHSYAGIRATLRDVPASHWDFFETKLVSYLETETHIFVHANAYPDMDMAEQPDYFLDDCDTPERSSS